MTEHDPHVSKSQYEAHADAELQQLLEQLESLRAQSRTATVQLRILLERKLNRLSGQGASLKSRLAELRSASADSWQRMRGSLDRARSDLAAGLKYVSEQLHAEDDRNNSHITGL